MGAWIMQGVLMLNNKLSVIVHAFLTLIFLSVALATPVLAQEDGDAVSIGTYRVIRSNVLGEERRLLVVLPRDYEQSNIKYPVVYHLYGDYIPTYFAEAYALVDELADTARTPQMILIGIDNPDRYRDMRPLWPDGTPAGSDKFLQYLIEEAIPFVEANYRTEDFRILVGPQAGAVFCLYALMEKPEAFDAFILENPFNEEANARWLSTRATEFFPAQQTLDKFLHITFAGGDDRFKSVAKVYELADLLAPLREKGLRLELNHLVNNEDFIPPICLKEGLIKLFKDYQMPDDYQVAGVADIKNYYAELARKWGFEVYPSEIGLTFKFDGLQSRGLVDEAVAVLEYQLTLYPTSVNAYWRLAGINHERGNLDEAVRLYQKCIELSPNVAPMARRMIERIEAERNKD
jgi:predicted alpha/beta superfamily hydrolase